MASTRTTTSDEPNTYVLVVSNGRNSGSNVFLVIEDADGHQVRYRIPGIKLVEFKIGGEHKYQSHLVLTIGDAHLETKCQISPGDVSASDLMSEVAALLIRKAEPRDG